MSGGLRIKAPQDPDYDPSGPYPDHLYLYTGGVDSYHYAATRSQQWPPNTVGSYRNTDPVLISYLIRLAVEKRGEEYLSFPQRALFDAGLVCRTDDRGEPVVQLAPPLICEQEHFDLIGEILRSVLSEAWTRL